MSRVALVTGASTPIALCTIERLLAPVEGAPSFDRVLAVCQQPRPDGLDPRVVWHRADLSRNREVRRLLFGAATELKVDTIIDLAMHRSAHARGERVHRLNVDATRELLRLAERHATIRRFVYRSWAEVYRVRGGDAVLIAHDHPLELSPEAPQWIRDRVEADLTVCTRTGLSPLKIAVLRCAECLAPASGSQMWDYLQSRVRFVPAGYDPMMNLSSVEDLSVALGAAALTDVEGVIPIPGADTLPLSEIIRRWGRVGVPVPAPIIGPLYAARAATRRTDFRWDLNRWRFHHSGVLDGARAAEALDYTPSHPLTWPT